MRSSVHYCGGVLEERLSADGTTHGCTDPERAAWALIPTSVDPCIGTFCRRPCVVITTTASFSTTGQGHHLHRAVHSRSPRLHRRRKSPSRDSRSAAWKKRGSHWWYGWKFVSSRCTASGCRRLVGRVRPLCHSVPAAACGAGVASGRACAWHIRL